jgi:hypothetical protein
MANPSVDGKRMQFYDGPYTFVSDGFVPTAYGDAGALLHGAGTETYPVTSLSADVKFLSYYCKTNAAAGDTRTCYFNLEMGGAGAATADAVRSRISVSGTAIGYATGLHSTCQVQAGGTVGGSSSGLRATYEAAAATRTLGGALSALHLASYVGAGNTMPTNNSFIRCTKDGSVDFGNLLQLPAVAVNGSIFAAHTTQTMTHSVRIIDSAGTAYYVMCCNAATNRS